MPSLADFKNAAQRLSANPTSLAINFATSKIGQKILAGCCLAVVVIPIFAILSSTMLGLRQRENPPFEGRQATLNGVDNGYKGCGVLLNPSNSLPKEELKQALLKVPKGKNFADNVDILEGFTAASEKYKLSNVYIAAHAAHESAWGTSAIALDKKNLFGYRAYDRGAYENAQSFRTYTEGTDFIMDQIKKNYLTPGGKYYVTENTLSSANRSKAESIKRASGVSKIEPESLEAMNVNYASDPNWANAIKNIMITIFKASGKSPQLTGTCPNL